VSAYTNISIRSEAKTVASILNELLSRTNLQYIERNNTIIIAERENVIQPGGTIRTQATFSVKGTLVNEKGEPVEGATVFLSKTKNIAPSDAAGEFNLGQLKPGEYELVVKMLGYYPHKEDIIIHNNAIDVNIVLKENKIALNTVVIKAGKADPLREEYLKVFKQYFIGESFNSLDCEIVNPEVLNLYYNRRKNILEASSDEFLIIDNYSLGYRINYLMSRFELNMKSSILVYKGSAYFEELDGSAPQLEQWELNRQATYRGSLSHFFKSLFNNSVQTEGFFIYQVPKKQTVKRLPESELLKIKPIRTDSIFTIVNENLKELKLNPSKSLNEHSLTRFNSLKPNTNTLYIVYTKEREPMEFIVTGRHIPFPLNKKLSAQSQISTMDPLSNSILISRNGGFPPESFLFKGYWSWENIADMLPSDYDDHPAKGVSELRQVMK
jgi:hypothetical protein